MACQELDTYCRMGDMWRAVFARRALAEIAEELGRFDEARHHLEANLAHFSQMGDERGREEYHERLEHLDDRIRSTGPETRTQETSAPVASPAQPSRPSAGDLVEPLSTRQLEILHLLAEGLTNREIAQQVYLSPNTVRVHISHIYGKLGVNNRKQAVAKGRALGVLG